MKALANDYSAFENAFLIFLWFIWQMILHKVLGLLRADNIMVTS
jgi:hypothetical protein